MSADAPPPPEPKPFLWNGRKLDAARLVAEDALSDERIAARVGIDRRQLTRWKAHPDFAAKVQAIVAELGERSLRFAIARRHRRVQALNARWKQLWRIRRERAADPAMQDVAGGRTGLMVRRVKSIGGGEHAREVEEYEVDTGLLKELREHEKQAAQELGQWSERRELSGPNGRPLAFIEVRHGDADRGDDPGRASGPGVQLPPGPEPGLAQ